MLSSWTIQKVRNIGGSIPYAAESWRMTAPLTKAIFLLFFRVVTTSSHYINIYEVKQTTNVMSQKRKKKSGLLVHLQCTTH